MGRRIYGCVGQEDKAEKNFLFHCPGCKYGHGVNNIIWTWNGSYELPTFNPSILTGDGPDFAVRRCHSYITDGKIQFLPDCYHDLKGQTVDLPDLDFMFEAHKDKSQDSRNAAIMFGDIE